MKRGGKVLLVFCMAWPWHAGAQAEGTAQEAWTQQAALLEEPANAAALEHWARQLTPVMQGRLRDLAASGEPRKLYAAGRLWDATLAAPEDAEVPAQPSQQAVAWLQAAIDARPRDPLVARVELAACPQAVDCDAEGALRFLLQAEPDNADIQLRAMDAAQRRGDAAGSERHWQAAVLARRFDPRALELGWALHEAYRGLSLPVPGQDVAAALERVHALGLSLDPQGIADLQAMNLFAIQAMPPLQGLLRRCRTPATEARRDECMSLLGLLADDETTLFAPLLALKTMAELTAGTPDQAPWAERLRVLKWQQQSVMPLTTAWPSLPAGAMADYFDTFLREGELAAYRALLHAHGLPSVPPQGWQPDR